MYKIGFKIISPLSLKSELSFDSEDSEKNLARSSSLDNSEFTQIHRRLNRVLKAICKRRRGRHLCGRAACILGMES